MTEELQPEHTTNLDALPVTKNLIDVHQEGNYLVAMTELGVRFRQRIPVNKILTKEGDNFRLKDRVAA